jgi:hypothetical protein
MGSPTARGCIERKEPPGALRARRELSAALKGLITSTQRARAATVQCHIFEHVIAASRRNHKKGTILLLDRV